MNEQTRRSRKLTENERNDLITGVVLCIKLADKDSASLLQIINGRHLCSILAQSMMHLIGDYANYPRVDAERLNRDLTRTIESWMKEGAGDLRSFINAIDNVRFFSTD